MTATYIKSGRGRSINAELAMESGRYPASYIAKALGRGCTGEFIKAHAPHSGEWHHVGKYAAEVEFYDLPECQEWFATEMAQAALATYKAARKAAKDDPEWIVADLEIKEFSEGKRHLGYYRGRRRGMAKCWKCEIVVKKEARCTIKGQWIEIEGYGRKSLKNVTVTPVTKAEIADRRAAEKKAATLEKRRATLAAKKLAAAQAAVIAAIRILPQPLALPAPKLEGLAAWAAAGMPHPAPAAVVAAKIASGLGWRAFELQCATQN